MDVSCHYRKLEIYPIWEHGMVVAGSQALPPRGPSRLRLKRFERVYQNIPSLSRLFAEPPQSFSIPPSWPSISARKLYVILVHASLCSTYPSDAKFRWSM